ncbi:MAG: hypothetical protein ACREJ2_02700 [Planctomycetota bacterium]
MSGSTGGDWDAKKDAGSGGGGGGGGDDYQLRQDADHLKILSIVWYVLAGLQALVGLCGGLYFLVFGALFGAAAAHNGGGAGAAAGFIPICMGLMFLLLAAVFAVLNFMVARGLAQRKRYMLCLVMAFLVCLSIPIGTIIGVFTIIVLFRPTVKQAFGQQV